jgi:regulator of RNase E activity RraA
MAEKGEVHQVGAAGLTEAKACLVERVKDGDVVLIQGAGSIKALVGACLASHEVSHV